MHNIALERNSSKQSPTTMGLLSFAGFLYAKLAKYRASEKRREEDERDTEAQTVLLLASALLYGFAFGMSSDKGP
jgi:hypothetical protein